MPMEETEANPSKFVIRKLPPNLCEADFHKLLTDVCQDELEWFRYHPGSFTTTGIRTSTAFLKLKHPELAPILSQVLQQTPFSGEHGVQYNCEMSVALFQKVPKEREKQDPYMGTYKEDPFYEQLLQEMEEEDEEMSKGPTVSATTTIPEEPPKETIITPLMQHVIDAHNPKASSGRRQRTSSGGGGCTNAREKENQKKAHLPSIAENTRADGKGGSSTRIDGKRVRERKTGKDATGNAAAKAQAEAAHAAASKKIKGRNSVADSDATARSSKRESKRENGKGKSDKKEKSGDGQTASDAQTNMPVVPPDVGDLVAAQAVARAAAALSGGALAATASLAGSAASTDTKGGSGQHRGSVSKNGASSSVQGAAKSANGEAKRSIKASSSQRSRPGRGKRTSRTAPEKGSSQDLSNPRISDATSNSTPKSNPTAADRVAQAAAAAAAAALGDAPGKPARRPALQARGVRDALSRAGIKKSPSKGAKVPAAGYNGT